MTATILASPVLATITSLSEQISELETENANLRAALSDPRVARVLADIMLTEDAAVLRISTHRDRDTLIARLAELADMLPRPYSVIKADRLLCRLGVANSTHPDLVAKVKDPTITGNASAARVLARLTAP
jgi:hypothetical protein